MKLLITLLLCSASALAQCPVQYEKFFPRYVWRTPRGLYNVKVKFKNVSGKTITGMKFAAIHFDAVGDAHSDIFNYADGDKMKPGDSRTDMWGYTLYGNLGYREGELWLQKAVFEDGTSWQDDGSHSCKVSSIK